MSDALSATFTALAHPVRRAILERLSRGSATVGELSEPFGISPPAVSNHLKILEQAGLVAREVEAQHRRLSLCGEGLGDAEAWIGTMRKISDDGFDRVEAHLVAIRRQLRRPKGGAKQRDRR